MNARSEPVSLSVASCKFGSERIIGRPTRTVWARKDAPKRICAAVVVARRKWHADREQRKEATSNVRVHSRRIAGRPELTAARSSRIPHSAAASHDDDPPLAYGTADSERSVLRRKETTCRPPMEHGRTSRGRQR
jgi:hypothetical protein